MTTKRPSLLVDQAAARIGVSRRTMYYWITKGKVQYFRVCGSLRVYLDSLPKQRGAQ